MFILISCRFSFIWSVMMMGPNVAIDGEIGYHMSFPIVTITYFGFHVVPQKCLARLRKIPHFRISGSPSTMTGCLLSSTNQPIHCKIYREYLTNSAHNHERHFSHESRDRSTLYWKGLSREYYYVLLLSEGTATIH